MKLLFTRHAETNPNGHDVTQNGGVLGALSEKGQDQASRLAKHLSEFNISYIYSSDILRAIATSYIISDTMPDVTVMLTKDLRIKDPSESNENFQKRLKTFLDGLVAKYDKQAILVVTHQDVIQNILKLLDIENPTSASLGAVSEFEITHNNPPKAIRVNDTSFLN